MNERRRATLNRVAYVVEILGQIEPDALPGNGLHYGPKLMLWSLRATARALLQRLDTAWASKKETR